MEIILGCDTECNDMFHTVSSEKVAASLAEDYGDRIVYFKAKLVPCDD